MHKIGFIGAGNMAFALAKAIKKAKLGSIIASDIRKQRLNLIKKELQIQVTENNYQVLQKSDIVFLAVKPQVIDFVLDEIKDYVKHHLIISIAAGITIKRLNSKLKNKKIVRVMPNTPCLVGEMAAGFAVGKNVTQADIKIVEKILNSAGKAFLVKEELLDVVTGLSGSGPAFVARLIEAFYQAGIKQGLSKDVSAELTLQTFKGTAALLQGSNLTPDQLVKMVSSPGGTTIAGREILEKSNYKDIIIKTIEQATKRSKELGE